MTLAGMLVASLMLVGPAVGFAQEPAPLPLWEFGVFGMAVSQQVYPGASQQLQRNLLLPYVVYRGEWFRVDRSGVELRKSLGPNVELDLGLAAAFGASSDDVEARQGMPDLGTFVEFGPRIRWTLHEGADHGRLRAVLGLRGVLDVTDHLRDKGMVLEPQLAYERRTSGGLHYSASAGLLIGDERLADTLYGVAPRYATPTRNSYAAQGGLIASRISLYVSKPLAPGLRIAGGARMDSVAGAANQDSPLVQKTTGASVGLWLTYTLGKSEILVRD